MKKVLLINGSPRKKNTYTMLKQIEEILTAQGFGTEILNLYDYEIKDCGGCEKCIYDGGGCWRDIDDGMAEIRQKVLAADGLVLASPVYMRGVTSKFKAFADRTCAWFHCPETAGKAVMSAAVTASTGLGATGDFLKDFAVGFGARTGEYVSRKEDKMTPVREKEIRTFISLLKNDKSQYKPTPEQLIIFRVQQCLALRSGKADKVYWAEKGWLGKTRYYYPCRISPSKKLLSAMLRKILRKALKVPKNEN